LTFFSLTKSGNTLKLYKNGVSIATKTVTTPISLNNYNIYLGYNFVGILDEVALYSSALTPTEIANQNSALNLPTATCSPLSCSNNGICGGLNNGVQCFCSQCFSGTTCSAQEQGCTNPCLNGGTYSSGSCKCAPGFIGSTCGSIRKCSALNDSTGNFVQSEVYQGVIGTCPSGNGSPKRQCLHNGSWQDVSSPCSP